MSHLKLFSRSVPFTGRVPAPERVSIETTRFCNLRCPMCLPFLAGSTVRGPHMDMEAFREVGARIFPFIRYWQPSVSGEPTVSPHLVEMAEEAGRYGVKVDMVTNGTRLDAARIERIAPHLASVYVSFDAPDKETFEAIREGARFERVVAAVRDLVRICRARVPPAEMPRLGINCTLMRRNVRSLPDLVDFAADELGVGLVVAGHVYPESEEMKAQSLAHDLPLARRCIDEALERAKKRGMKLYVQALDQLTAATALGSAVRAVPMVDGVVEGLEQREFSKGDPYELPPIRPDGRARALRAAAAARATFPAPHPSPSRRSRRRTPGAFPCCDFLWKRSYVDIAGDVRTCCVPGAPVVGNLKVDPFDRIWNNESYRALRRRIAAGDPVAACKGCQHIRGASGTDEVHALLQGMAVPRPSRDGTDLPLAVAVPAAGSWTGWVGAGEHALRVGLHVAGTRAGRACVPGLERGWVALTDLQLANYSVGFTLAAGGAPMRFTGTLESSLNAIAGTLTDAQGGDRALRLGRIPPAQAMSSRASWDGQVAGGARQELRLRLGASIFGERFGWIDWPAESLVETPIDSWERTASGLRAFLQVEGARVHVELASADGDDRLRGTVFWEGREPRALDPGPPARLRATAPAAG